MNSFYKNKRKKGYSLAEVLVTVTILLILMAIAVPSVFTIRKNLRQKALDNKAELIYTAVQNNLVKLQNNGNSSVYAGNRATQVEENPSDADGDKSSILYYVTSDKKEDTGNAASVLVTKDTIDDELYSHYWVIEYNPDSASVYAVFYSETRDDYNTSNYNPLRYKKNRLKDGAQVGYYGGDMILSGSTSILEPTLTITNEEKLVATISCKRPDMNDLSFEVTLEDGEGHSLTLKYKPSGTMLVHQTDDLYWDGAKTGENEVGTVRGIRYELKLTLDDLSKEELRFNKLYGPGNTEKIKEPNKGLTPGSTLKINVTVKSLGMFADEAEVSAVTNSLFADNTTENKAYVKYGRHLQNLDKASGITDKITLAVQQSDIHFEKQNDLDVSTEDTTSWYSCYTAKPFTPITNDHLKEFISCFSDGVSGSTPVIYHLTVQNQKNAGLFATLADNMTVDSVRLSGAKITGNGDDSTAGAIAGETAGTATIKNCQVFLSNDDVAGKTVNDYWITNAAVQGGLIGTTNGEVIIDKSFAATVMGSEDAKDVGGLVGVAKGEIAVTNSYSDSYLTGNRTGGILASSPDGKDVKITSCYTAGYQMPKTAGGGMAANITGDTDATIVSDCYTAVTWPLSSENSGELQPENITIYSLSPGNAEKSYFLNGGTDYFENPSEFEKNSKGVKIDYKFLSDRTNMAVKLGDAFTGSVISTNAYNLKNQGLTGYSYPALKGMPHYGDWEANFEPGSLVYYEVYQEDENTVSYGVYGGNMTSTLLDNKTIVGDGYGIAYEANSAEIPQKGITITYQTKDSSGSKRIAVKVENAKKYSVSVDNKTYVVFPLPAEIINAEAIPGSYYQKLSIHSETITGENAEENTGSSGDANLAGVFYYNPHFAKTAVNASEAPKVQPEISIRTARQLYHLSLYYPDYAEEVKNGAFVQEVNIDYSAYRWIDYADKETPVSVQEPIGVKGTKIIPFTSIYNGNYHEIRGVSFSTAATAVGFIGNNSKTVQNVFLVSDYSADGPNPYLKYRGTIGANRTVYMGALAGMNSGRIQNCAVSGYTMSTAQKIFVRSNGTFYFGGLTGSNSGLIMNCEADTPLIKAEILYGYAYLAGFAGENAAGGRIRNSYAIGHIMVENAKGGKTVISGFTSRNAGYLSGDYCAVALTASGEKTTSYGFSPRSNVSNCSYLSGGTFHYLGKLYAFDNESGSGTKKTYKEMAVESTVSSHCHSATGTDVSYPFKTVVTDANGNAVHYGNWETMADLGAIGVIYWEHEQGGSNDGYHFSYIGYKANTESPNDTLDRISGSTLCTQHDDGGIIKEYGYGYYYASTDESELNEEIASGAGIPQGKAVGFRTGDPNSEASKALSNRLNGFTVVAYTTKPSIDGMAESGRSYMQMTATDRTVINGVWQFTYQNLEYTFTINPFFANAMQYNGAPKSLKVRENGGAVQADTTYPKPGSEGCQYQIRSADQLQYMNWNCMTGNACNTITSGDTNIVEGYIYLGCMYSIYKNDGNISENIIKQAKYYWYQSHDVDADMNPQATTNLFTPIGSLFDTEGSHAVAQAKAYMSYLNGSFDGNTYTIKNVEINSTGTSVGLFGGIIGADVRNVVLYSDKGNYIQRSAKSPKTWYVMGGLCGFAAVGQDNNAGTIAIENCTVSGYFIQDNSTSSAWGDACIGGMFGMSTMDLRNCTAVNNIVLNTNYTDGQLIKKDGVSVRTGGLVGSMRGNIGFCYTGGEIICTDLCLSNATNPYGSKLFLGGITGGICMKSGNFLALMGKTVKGVTGWKDDTGSWLGENTKKCQINTTYIYNCYTYIKMPDSQEKIDAIKSIEPIGSNGETPFENEDNYHVKVKVEKCYYYRNNIPNTKQFRIMDHGKDGLQNAFGLWGNPMYRDWTNIESDAMALEWSQLAGQELIDGKTLTALLGEIPQEAQKLGLTNDRTFSAVTTMENGQNVDGKYSFPGTRTDLDGENYPFPTILKQGESIDVHYGEWPREGIYWEESRANMDIFENLQLDVGNDNDGWAVKTFKLVDPKSVLSRNLSTNEFNVTYSNGEENTTVESFASNDEEIAAAFLDGTDFSENVDTDGFSSGAETASATASAETQDEEPGTVLLTGNDRIAEIIDIRYDTNENGYIATVKALKTGATIITVSVEGSDNKEYSASFNLSVSAELSVYAEPEILELGINDSKDVTVHAVPSASLSVNGTEETVNVEEQNAASGWIIDSTSVDMITDEEFYTEVFAAGAVQFLQKDLASRMTWTVESDDPDIIECTEVSDSKFTVLCHGASDSPVTLTVKGSYSYNGIDYSGVTWVEVKITGNTGIRWEKDTESVILSSTSATKIFKLEDKSGCLANAPDLTSFSVEPYSEQPTTVDEGTMIQGPLEEKVTVTNVEKITDGYNVTMVITSAGSYKITVSAKGKDGKDYIAAFILTASDSSELGQAGDTDEIISSNTSQEDFGFISDDIDNLDDQNGTYVDMIPYQNSDVFSDEGSGWES